jgi:iron complex transport system permease protein
MVTVARLGGAATRGTREPVGPRAGTGASPRRSDRALVAGLVGALVLLAAVCLLSVAVGSRSIPVTTSWHLLWHDDGSDLANIVHTLRVPRTLLGLLVGVALGLSGVIMQALTLNPLADPGLLGVNVGASTAVVIAIGVFGVTSVTGYLWFAFAGAGLTSVAVFLLGSTGRRPTPERQVLAGVAITSVLGAFIYAMLVTRRETFDRFRFWNVGSLAERDLQMVGQVLPFILVGTALAVALARPLNALALGEQAGRALGAPVLRSRILGMLAITLLCGAATAAAGPIWFVGLAVPVAVRLVTGPDHRWVLAYSAAVAPALLLASDVLGRVLVRPAELEVGIVTALVGAPVFIALARRRRVGLR